MYQIKAGVLCIQLSGPRCGSVLPCLPAGRRRGHGGMHAENTKSNATMQMIHNVCDRCGSKPGNDSSILAISGTGVRSGCGSVLPCLPAGRRRGHGGMHAENAKSNATGMLVIVKIFFAISAWFLSATFAVKSRGTIHRYLHFLWTGESFDSHNVVIVPHV
jgi:hypothetical protein